MIEGVLLLIVSWMWKDEPKHVPLYYMVSGIIGLSIGIVTWLYKVEIYRDLKQGD